MALNFEGVEVTINPNLLPAGYTPPTVTTFSDDNEGKYINRTFSVPKAGVENASDVTTFTALVAQLVTDATTLLSDELDVTKTIDAFARLTKVTTNAAAANTGAFYTSTAVSYVCTMTVRYKIS